MATIQAIGKYTFIASVLLLCLVPEQSHAGGFNTAQLLYNSMQIKCVDWKIVGLCFWLKCSPKCKIRTTPKISHYLPDFTVTNSPGQCPWQEANLLSLRSPSNIAHQLLNKTSGGNPGQGGRTDRYAMKFKDTMVIGNPIVALTDRFNVRFLCKSRIKPMHIYFNSRQGLNALTWRGIDLTAPPGTAATDTDKIESWQLSSRMVGRSNTSQNGIIPDSLLPHSGWGSIYPRRGTVLNPNDVHAGAVIAQRAIEIVVRNPAGYRNVTAADVHNEERPETWGNTQTPNRRKCIASGGRWQQLMQNRPSSTRGKCLQQHSVQQRDVGDESTDRWQMIYPETEAECASFDQHANRENDWSSDKASAEGAYGYNFWQKYKCCIPRSGHYLFSIEWSS
ncbi:MAG: TraU family protein [Chromatiales bacterium]|nr:TraU family protein [Chromatiales bacterium]